MPRNFGRFLSSQELLFLPDIAEVQRDVKDRLALLIFLVCTRVHEYLIYNVIWSRLHQISCIDYVNQLTRCSTSSQTLTENGVIFYIWLTLTLVLFPLLWCACLMAFHTTTLMSSHTITLTTPTSSDINSSFSLASIQTWQLMKAFMANMFLTYYLYATVFSECTVFT